MKPAKYTLNVTATNRYKVPLKQWYKWHIMARVVFNDLYRAMMQQNGENFYHPKQAKAPRTHWKTTAWNAAWTAADSATLVIKEGTS